MLLYECDEIQATKLPGLRPTDTDDYTPDEEAQWAIIDAAEKIIHAGTAATPQGAEAQLWTSLYYLFIDNEQVNAEHAALKAGSVVVRIPEGRLAPSILILSHRDFSTRSSSLRRSRGS